MAEIEVTYTGARDGYRVKDKTGKTLHRLPRGKATKLPAEVAATLRGRKNITVHGETGARGASEEKVK